MQKNTSVTLGTHFDEFIAQQVEYGRYGSVSETIRAGLRLLEARELKLAALRQVLIASEESGKTGYSVNDLIEELDAE